MPDKKKVLVVDDEKDLLKVIKLNLEDTGRFEVLALSSPKEIISTVNSFRPDVIILDLVMPGIGGLEVCDMLNNDPIGKNTPILVLSALEKDTDKRAAYRKGIVDYLTKPIGAKDLIARIDKILQNR